jgi:hypothetical protein
MKLPSLSGRFPSGNPETVRLSKTRVNTFAGDVNLKKSKRTSGGMIEKNVTLQHGVSSISK